MKENYTYSLELTRKYMYLITGAISRNIIIILIGIHTLQMECRKDSTCKEREGVKLIYSYI